MSVSEVKQAVTKFSRAELSAFREWFAEFDGHRWDQEIAEDAASGKLDKLAEEAHRDYARRDDKEL